MDTSITARDSGAPPTIGPVALNASDLEAQRRWLTAIVEDCHDAIVGAVNGIIVTWNTGAEQLYGYTQDEAIGLPVSTVIPAERAGEFAGLLSRLERGERLPHFETERLHKNGTRVPVSLTLSPVRDVTGAIVGTSTVARDITERRGLEERMRQAQRMDAIGQLASEVAHDFNNMLTAILGNTELVLEGLPKRDPLRIHMDEVRMSARRAAALTQQLLTASRQPMAMPPRRAQRKTILVVEDEEAVRKFARRVLERDGYAVHAVADPRQAIELVRAGGEAIDVVVTDVVLPEMNGRVMATTLRQHDPSMKVLYMSGYAEQTIVNQAVIEDGATFLHKPFTADALARSVRALIEHQIA